MVKKEEQKFLKPEINKIESTIENEEEFKKTFENIPIVELAGLEKEALPDIIRDGTDKNESADTFFKSALENLFSDKNIELKTEYADEDKTYTGAKLSFLTSECGFQMSKSFLPTWEKKQVSLGRNSRKEIVMTMWERQKEIVEQERRKNLEMQLQMG